MKKREVREKVNFSIPFSVSKGIVDDDNDIIGGGENIKVDRNKMFIEGVASTPDLDLDKQRLKPSGFILDYFLQSGFINWNHQGNVSPDALIGEPVDVRVDNEKFFMKSRLFPWSTMARSVYDLALNLETDENTDRTLGYSVEGLAMETEDEEVSKLLVTGCACCFVPKNNKTYVQICKGITIDQVRQIREKHIFKPVYTETIKGVTTNYILNLQVGDKRILVDEDYNFHTRHNDDFGLSGDNITLEDIQKAIIAVSMGFKEGFIKESKKNEFLKVIEAKKKLLIR